MPHENPIDSAVKARKCEYPRPVRRVISGRHVQSLFEHLVEAAIGAAQGVPRPFFGDELGGQQWVELKVPDHGDGQCELIGEVVGADRFDVELVAHGQGEPARVDCPIIKTEKGSHVVGRDVRSGAVEVNALLVQHGAQRRQAVPVEIVRANPDALP